MCFQVQRIQESAQQSNQKAQMREAVDSVLGGIAVEEDPNARSDPDADDLRGQLVIAKSIPRHINFFGKWLYLLQIRGLSVVRRGGGVGVEVR